MHFICCYTYHSQPDIKVIQIQLGGFLGKEAPAFCKKLWNLCLSAQAAQTGVPQELLEAKKNELMQAKVSNEWRELAPPILTIRIQLEQVQATETVARRREGDLNRDRGLDEIRSRERMDRGSRSDRGYGRDRDGGRGRGGGGRGGRDDRTRPSSGYYSRSPSPKRRRRDYDDRRPDHTDTYIPSKGSRYAERSRTPPHRRNSPPPRRSARRSPSYDSRSPSRERKYSRIDRDRSPYRKDRRSRDSSPPPRRRSVSQHREPRTKRSPRASRDRSASAEERPYARRDRSRSASRSRHNRRGSISRYEAPRRSDQKEREGRQDRTHEKRDSRKVT